MGRIPSDKSGLKKGPWTPDEDQKLIDYIHKHGHGRWRTLPKNAGLKRCGKSCRLRWANYLRPDIKRGRFSFEEEEAIIQLHRVLGNKWSTIASRLPGRTDNEIKNHWNTHIRKRLVIMGLDPVTHAPRLDLVQLSSFLYSTFYNLNNVPNPLGIGPFMDPELLNLLATTLLSCQGRSQFLSRLHQENQLIAGLFETNPNQFQSQLLVQQLRNPLNNASFQHQPQLTEFSSKSSSVPTTTNQLGSNYDVSKFESIINSRTQSNDVNQYQNFQNMGGAFDSLLSTTPLSASPGTTLDSSPAMTYVNSSTFNEDERDSFCSNILNTYHHGFSGTELL